MDYEAMAERETNRRHDEARAKITSKDGFIEELVELMAGDDGASWCATVAELLWDERQYELTDPALQERGVAGFKLCASTPLASFFRNIQSLYIEREARPVSAQDMRDECEDARVDIAMMERDAGGGA